MIVYSHQKNPYLRMYFSEYGSGSMAMPYSSQAPAIPEPISKSFQTGFEQEYSKQKDFTPEEIQKYTEIYQKMKPKVDAVVNLAKSAESWLHHHGIPAQAFIQIGVAGLVGGRGAIPVAAINFIALKAAGALVDVGEKAGKAVAAKITGQQPAQPSVAHESFGFRSYCHMRMLEEENLWTKAAERAGQAAGWVAGKVAKWSGAALNLAKKITNGLIQQASSIVKFAKENKLAVAKAAIITACSIMIGAGIGVTYKKLMEPETAGSIAKAVIDAGLGSAQDVQTLLGDVATDALKEIPHHLTTAGGLAHAGAELGANTLAQAGISGAGSAEAGVASMTGAGIGGLVGG